MRTIAIVAVLAALICFEVPIPVAVQLSAVPHVLIPGTRIHLGRGTLTCPTSSALNRVASLIGQHDRAAALRQAVTDRCQALERQSVVVFEASTGWSARRVRPEGALAAFYVSRTAGSRQGSSTTLPNSITPTKRDQNLVLGRRRKAAL